MMIRVNLRSPLAVLGAVGGRQDVPVADQGAAAPELGPPVAVQVHGRHPGVLPVKGGVAAHDPGLGHLGRSAFLRFRKHHEKRRGQPDGLEGGFHDPRLTYVRSGDPAGPLVDGQDLQVLRFRGRRI